MIVKKNLNKGSSPKENKREKRIIKASSMGEAEKKKTGLTANIASKKSQKVDNSENCVPFIKKQTKSSPFKLTRKVLPLKISKESEKKDSIKSKIRLAIKIQTAEGWKRDHQKQQNITKEL